MHAATWMLLAMLSPAAAAPAHASDAHGGRFEQRTVTVAGAQHRYQVYVPHQLSQTPPIILFLHGSGERGNDGDAPTRAGLGPWLRHHGKDFPAVVVFPQAAPEQEWLGANIAVASATLEAASAEFGADPQRTYLTGMSMGGYGVWELALQQPHRFAALIPVCGALTEPRPARPTLVVEQAAGAADPFRYTVQRLAHVPVWMFHGALDDVVPPDDARHLQREAQALGANFRYTEYPQGNHNAWDVTYANPDVWRWLFDQRRR